MLALGFLLMIGMTLIADGMGYHVPKGYIYAAMGFSALVEGLNMLARRRQKVEQARKLRETSRPVAAVFSRLCRRCGTPSANDRRPCSR